MIGTIKEVTNFIRDSALRMNHFLDKLKQEKEYNSGKKIKKMCETRWVERHEALSEFYEMLPLIIDFLTDLVLSTNRITSSKANNLLLAITSCDFIVSLVCANELISITVPLSRQLQTPDLDVYKASEITKLVISIFEDMRKDCDQNFLNVFEKLRR